MITFKSTHAKISIISIIVVWFIFIFSVIISGYFPVFLKGFSTNDVFAIHNYEAVLNDLYVSEGSGSLKKFMIQSNDKRGIRLALITPDKQIIGPALTAQESKALLQTPFKPGFGAEYMLIDNFSVYTKTNKQGQKYKVAIDVTKMPHKLTIWTIPMVLRLILLLTLFPALFYWLGSYYFASLHTVALSILKLSKGQLDTRLGSHFHNSSGDLKQLGDNFDVMAQHFESLFLAKKEMLQHIAHELRTPLARARMAASLLSSEVSIKGLEDLNLLEQQMATLETLIDKILSLAKLNNDSVALSLNKFNITELVQHIVENANYEVKQTKGIFQAKAPLLIKADKTLLSSAIENIVRNAFIHSGENATVWVDVTNKNNQTVITIMDNGPGIDELKLKTIFEPFIQSKNKKSAEHHGYGLGMAIALKVMSLHGGTINIKNIKPHGLSISLCLPACH